MINLSASSIKDFLSCQKRYYYRRYFSSEAQPSVAMDIGTVVHNTIEKASYEEQSALAFARLEASKVSLDGVHLRKVEQSVKNYFKFFESTVRGKRIEHESFFDLPFIDGVHIRGKFDVVLEGNTIIDWKTSERTPITTSNDIQFILYDWAFEKIYGFRPYNNLYASLLTGKFVKYRKNQDNERVLFDEVIPHMLRTIELDNFSRTGMLHFQRQCTWCSYKEKCFDELASRNNTKES